MLRRGFRSGRVALISVAVAGLSWVVTAASSTVSAIRTTPQSRENYLAHAQIWLAPGRLSPEDILGGPQRLPDGLESATTSPIECTFASPGNTLGGASQKFLCVTKDARTLRLKYWDPATKHGNLEVFATVAATRLLWALGFDA